jgi:DNA-nicking Smr family endonuclease
MNFGKVLDDWEKNKGKKPGKRAERSDDNMEHWLDMYGPEKGQDKEDATDSGRTLLSASRKQLLDMDVQDSLDLHGFTAAEAAHRIDDFLSVSAAKGLRKVLIIHGKGKHSSRPSVLTKVVADRVARHSLAGENRLSDKKDGGSGARWIILREKPNIS